LREVGRVAAKTTSSWRRSAEPADCQPGADADATRRDADDYVVDTLVQLQDNLEKVLNQVRNGVLTLQQERVRRGVPTSAVPEKIEK
jgi:hypothetical protein